MRGNGYPQAVFLSKTLSRRPLSDLANGRMFQMGGKFGVVPFCRSSRRNSPTVCLPTSWTRKNGIIVNLHIQSIDHNEAIKTIKRKITDLDRMKIEEQKKAIRSGYDMDIIPSDLATYGGEAKKPTPRFAEPQRKNVSAYAACLKPCRYQAEIG